MLFSLFLDVLFLTATCYIVILLYCDTLISCMCICFCIFVAVFMTVIICGFSDVSFVICCEFFLRCNWTFPYYSLEHSFGQQVYMLGILFTQCLLKVISTGNAFSGCKAVVSEAVNQAAVCFSPHPWCNNLKCMLTQSWSCRAMTVDTVMIAQLCGREKNTGRKLCAFLCLGFSGKGSLFVHG